MATRALPHRPWTRAYPAFPRRRNSPAARARDDRAWVRGRGSLCWRCRAGRASSLCETQIRYLADGQESGAIAAWASLYLSAFEALRLDPRVAPSRIAVWGHSRYGKAALLAAALDPRIGAVIANQSGTFGATLSSSTRGESAAQIVRRFPHWFPTRSAPPANRQDAEGLDQHLLLALLAPRPVLLGNAGLDRWSDPAASFAAARSASDAYALFDSDGLAQSDMRLPALAADIAFYVRPGGHGVRSSDWTRALDFLDLHFAAEPEPLSGVAEGG